MSITVGTNAYISISDADSYHSARGNSSWASLDDTAKEYALIKATNWLDAFYRLLWRGTRADYSQGLAWPRSGVEDPDGYYVDDSSIPQGVKDAVCEMAYKIAVNSEDPFEDEEPGIASEKVGPISIAYDGKSRRKKYPYIRELISGLIKGSSSKEIVRG